MPHKWLFGNFYLQRGSVWHLCLFLWRRAWQRRMERTWVLWSHTCPKSSWGLFLLEVCGGGGGVVGMVAEPSWILHVGSKRHRNPVWIGSHPLPAVTPNPAGFILTLRAFSYFLSPLSWEFPWSFVGMGRVRTKLVYGRWEHVSWARGWVDGWKKITKGRPKQVSLHKNKKNRPFTSRWSKVVAMEREGLGHRSYRSHQRYYSQQEHCSYLSIATVPPLLD